MAGYDSDQLKTIRTIRQIGKQRYGSDPAKYRRYVLTNLEIGDVESNFHNLSGGDADSAGYRQERASLYKNPTNLKAAINRAFDEIEQHDHGQSTGALAADVQRPAAQYRGRYQLALGTARQLAGGGGTSVTNAGAVPTVSKGTAPKLTQASTTTDTQGAVTAALLDPRKKMGLGARILENVQSGKYTTTTPAKVTPGTAPKYAVAAGTPTAPKGTSAKGTADFEGKKVAAWIAPALAYARKHGWKGVVNSGYRSFAEQARIYNSGVRPAAKPGTSNHEGTAFPRGAIDVSDAQQLSAILKASPYASKLVYAGAKDPVHFSNPHNGSY